MRWVVVKPPGTPQSSFILERHVHRAAGAGPPKSGARGGGEHRSSTITRSTSGVAIPGRATSAAGGFTSAGAVWLLRPFYPCRCDGHRAPETHAGSLGARPSFSPSVPAGTRSIRRGRAPAHAARGAHLAARGLLYATWPFTIAPCGISPYSTYRHSAMSSFRARATIPMRRCRRLPRPNFSSYQRVSALAG
jgi:hypothetical protein